MIFGRYIFPYILRYFLKRVSKQFTNGFNNYNNDQYQQKKEGEIKIDYSPDKNKSQTSEIGDYVDFEEIK